MTAGLVYGGLLLALQVAGIARALYGLRYTMPGWHRHGTPEQPRALIRGVIQATEAEQQNAPLSGEPCVAWRVRVRVRARRGFRGIAARDVFSSGRFSIGDDGNQVQVAIPQYEFVSDWLWATHPWVLVVDRAAPSLRLRLRYGVLMSQSSHILRSKDLERAALAFLREHEMTGPELETAELYLDETRIVAGERWVCEGPRFETVQAWEIRPPDNHRTYTGSIYPVKLAPEHNLGSAKRHLTLLHFAPILIIDALLLATFLLVAALALVQHLLS